MKSSRLIFLSLVSGIVAPLAHAHELLRTNPATPNLMDFQHSILALKAKVEDIDDSNQALKTKVEDLKAKVEDLKDSNQVLKAKVESLEDSNNYLMVEVETLQTCVEVEKTEGAHKAHIKHGCEFVVHGHHTVYGHHTVHGGNLFLSNGLGSHACTPAGAGEIPACTGTGNLILGFGAQDLEDGTGHKKISGDHNIVVGQGHTVLSHGGIVSGVGHAVMAPNAAAVAGKNNTVAGEGAVAVSGASNVAEADEVVVIGGLGNTASGDCSAVSGGSSNTASGEFSSVSGGSINTASGVGSSVSGGHQNTALGDASSVSGGRYNTASGWVSSVSGGEYHTASAQSSSVSGGDYNTASGLFSSVSGGHGNTASGGRSSVSGGYINTASGASSSVSGGLGNIASDRGSSVSGETNAFDLPDVHPYVDDEPWFDVTEAAGDFGLGDFRIEMDVSGEGCAITEDANGDAALFIRSGEAQFPYSGPSVHINENGDVRYRLRADEPFLFEGALPDVTDMVTRHLVFSRKGNTLVAMIDGTVYVRTIQKQISDVATLRAAPLRFRGNHVNSSDQSLYMKVTNIVIE